MKIYYLHDGANQSGPFTVQELQEKQINKDTPIWYEGLDEWPTAGEIAELKEIIKTTPPPITKKASPPPVVATAQPIENTRHEYRSNLSQATSKPKSGLKRIVKIAAVLFLIVIIGASIVNYRDKNSPDPFTNEIDYVQKVMTVEEIEQANPAKFIITEGKYIPTIFGKKFRIYGNVKNNATVAKYKDISIQIDYYSETETLLHSETFVLYEYLTPHLSKQFELKVNRPAGSTKIGLKTIGAIPY